MAKIILMVGLPASGKSTYTQKLAKEYNATILSSDKLREELYGDTKDQEHNDEVFAELHRRVKDLLSQGINVIYDACNISYKKRKSFLEGLKSFNCEKICYLVATPYEKCLEQNKLRERQVPDYVIKRMYLNFYIPQYYEGWQKINIINNFNKEDFNLNTLFYGENGLDNISQHNPHHTKTIGQHCLECAYNIDAITIELFQAALLHDIGKRFTKEFKNAKGETTDIAHYFQHHLVSAYDSLFYEIDCDRISRAGYILWHMQPFFIETEKAKNKFINLVGQAFYDEIMLLHQADLEAH